MNIVTVEILVLLSVALPFLAALASLAGPFKARASFGLAAVASAPLAAFALLILLGAPPAGTVRPEWLLTGLSFGVDEVSAVFVVIAAVLWTAAAFYSLSYFSAGRPPGRFAFFYFAAMGGNAGLVLAQDAVAFYLFFAVMTFSVYGLVIHNRDPGAVRAARVYMVMAAAGEALLVTALLVVASSADGLDFPSVREAVAGHPASGVLAGLIIVAYAVKAGVVPLHLWLPLAHPAAPAPASAVLSGVVIKAGLMGWVRFLPVGLAPLPGWGSALIAMGLFSAFYAVAVGVTQREAKCVLAYSSVSQMGLAAMTLGILSGPAGPGPAGLSALLLVAFHHSLAKGALFLGTGIQGKKRRALVIAGLAVPALSLAGAPFTSGEAAKAAIKGLAHAGSVPPPFYADWLLTASSAATAALMARFLHVSWSTLASDRHAPAGPVAVISWAAVTAASVVLFRLSAVPGITDAAGMGPYPGRVFSSAWPVLAGAAVYAVSAAIRRRTILVRLPAIPPGDLLSPVCRVLYGAMEVLRGAGSAVSVPRGEGGAGLADRAARLIGSGERALAGGRLPWLLVMLAALLLLLV